MGKTPDDSSAGVALVVQRLRSERKWGRMRWLRAAFMFVAVVVSASCSSSPAAPSDPVNLTLAPGDTRSASGLTVRFIRLVSDSRCPGDALCIQAGDAEVAIETTVFGLRQTAELALVAPAKRSTTHGSYTVTFETLEPYPFVSRGPIAPGDYRATFLITYQ